MVELSGETLAIALFVIGVILSAAEAVAPGAHLIVLGVALIAAGLAGLVLSAVLPGFLLTFIMATMVVVVGALALFAYRELDLYGGKGTARTKDSSALKGRTGRVTERVTPTSGEIKLDSGGFNPNYAARSLEGTIEPGTEVMVIDPGGGNVMTVTPLGPVEDEIDRELARGRHRMGQSTESQIDEGEREMER